MQQVELNYCQVLTSICSHVRLGNAHTEGFALFPLECSTAGHNKNKQEMLQQANVSRGWGHQFCKLYVSGDRSVNGGTELSRNHAAATIKTHLDDDLLSA